MNERGVASSTYGIREVYTDGETETDNLEDLGVDGGKY
jgi:hypothetical protein